MKPQAIKTLYWILTILFALAMLGDGYGGITRQQAGVEVLNHLGYPIYSMVIFGVAKVLGALAILQNRFATIKEWAYAGFTFNFIAAAASRAAVGDPAGQLVPPVVMLVILFVSYFLWKRYNKLNAVTYTTSAFA
ncbi:DoxX family protein [Mucilaginibacter sp. Bleaf8]|uniref:DoxX family protein n=1 Tax=Mucilaginibacter sp. Bleaf8 TaxID=2834430 RepID=UPI001BD12E79|nr:DoxX family protein [Mucilaginibacter sp. Bleaf8]MBS7564479.1 DoxX family protein [Mucilaginibacter sp. Bleaf8]